MTYKETFRGKCDQCGKSRDLRIDPSPFHCKQRLCYLCMGDWAWNEAGEKAKRP